MASDRPDQSETEQDNSDQQNDLQQLADLKIQEVSPELMIKHPLQVSILNNIIAQQQVVMHKGAFKC